MTGVEPTDASMALLRLELLGPLSEVRGEIAELRSEIRLVLQRLEQQDTRAADLTAEVRLHDARLDVVEKTAVTREELDTERRERRADRRILIGAALAAALSLLVTLISAGLLAAFGWK